MAKVSIIVPVYNVFSYLDKCLASLVSQTLEDIEIIVVNDGTKDDSQAIIDMYAQKDKRVKSYIKENGGLGDARNYGLTYATADYIGFVDSDDYIDPTMYEKMYDKALEEKSDIIECDFYWCYPKKMKLDIATYYGMQDSIMSNIRVTVCNKLFKKSLIIDNNITFPVGLRYEDILFTYKLLPYVHKISYVNEGLYYYVQRDVSLSNNQTAKVRDIFSILDSLTSCYKEKGIYDKYQDLIEYLYIRYLLGSSFLRILGIKDKKLRKTILEDNWQVLNSLYPYWKKNRYLQKAAGFKNKYYRLTNKFTYYLSSHLFRIKSR
ncbi:MAG: glycosyltransferase [Bacilli bacterium]|jgi:hypothetical protein